MRRLILAATAVAILSSAPSASWAGPLILATSIVPECKILPNGSVSTVTVTLNNVTHNFFGAGLYYHFTPGSGVGLPSPASNPNPVPVGFVAAGVYQLRISTNPGAGGVDSPNYPITVPAYAIQTLGSRKFCPAVRATGESVHLNAALPHAVSGSPHVTPVVKTGPH